MVWLFDHTARFPKHERFRLGRQIDDTVFAFHEVLLRAGQSDHPQMHLREADLQLDKLRVYLRLALELKYTTAQQYQHAARQIIEIGKLLGGWLKKA